MFFFFFLCFSCFTSNDQHTHKKQQTDNQRPEQPLLASRTVAGLWLLSKLPIAKLLAGDLHSLTNRSQAYAIYTKWPPPTGLTTRTRTVTRQPSPPSYYRTLFLFTYRYGISVYVSQASPWASWSSCGEMSKVRLPKTSSQTAWDFH